MNFSHIVTTNGYWALALLIGLEAFGIPFPGETILIAAGTYAGQTHKLSVWLIFACAVGAILVGSSAGYWVGLKGGYRLLRNYGRYIGMKEPEIKVGMYVFDKYGIAVVSAGRFVALLRTYAPFLAGTTRMSWAKFGVFNAIGAVLWAALWSFGSDELGNSLKHATGKVDLFVAIFAVVLVVAVIVAIRKQLSRLEAVAEAEYPGPLPD